MDAGRRQRGSASTGHHPRRRVEIASHPSVARMRRPIRPGEPAGTCGVAAALHGQPLELPWLRDFIRTQLSDRACPQLMRRLGTVIQVAVSVRRGPADVLY